MIRRTKGRLLITLLVVTGLSGTVDNSSINQRERKYALSMMKEGRNDVIEEVQDLSEAQLNYVSPATGISIRKCLLQIAYTEKQLWQFIETAMQQPANPEMRAKIRLDDDELIGFIQDGSISTVGSNTFKLAKSPWKNANNALNNFKDMRTDHIRYMKTSTEDLRNHVVLTPAGWFDCYQYILIMSAETKRYIKQIKELKSSARFPVQ